MQMKKRFPLVDMNAPVILSLFFAALFVLLLNRMMAGRVNMVLGSYRSAWLDPFMYLRLFTHVLAHANLAHFSGNFLLILAVGPLVEEKYGSKKLALMLSLTAAITGLVNVLFFHNVMLIGASGLVFMLILLASFTNIRNGRLPLTVLLVGLLYIGNEAVSGILSTVSMSNSRISYLSHIVGGLCGAGFGFFYHGGKMRRR